MAAPPRPPAALASAESMYREVRHWRDRIAVTSARGVGGDTDGLSMMALRRRYESTRGLLVLRLEHVDSARLGAEDQHALGAMRAALESGLRQDVDASESSDAGAAPSCDYDPAAVAQGDSAYEKLRARTYACYTRAVQRVQFEGKTLDRLTAIGMLATMNDREERHRLFLAIDTIWRSMNGDDRAHSPYRQLVKLSAARWRANGSPVDAEARVLGIDPAQMETWLVSVLDAWRAGTPSAMIEPWDWHYQAGAASRTLSDRIPRDDLSVLNARYFRDLGADVAALNVHYDLTPRVGKTPVAFTDFGGRPHS